MPSSSRHSSRRLHLSLLASARLSDDPKRRADPHRRFRVAVAARWSEVGHALVGYLESTASIFATRNCDPGMTKDLGHRFVTAFGNVVIRPIDSLDLWKIADQGFAVSLPQFVNTQFWTSLDATGSVLFSDAEGGERYASQCSCGALD